MTYSIVENHISCSILPIPLTPSDAAAAAAAAAECDSCKTPSAICSLNLILILRWVLLPGCTKLAPTAKLNRNYYNCLGFLVFSYVMFACGAHATLNFKKITWRTPVIPKIIFIYFLLEQSRCVTKHILGCYPWLSWGCRISENLPQGSFTSKW